MKELVYQNEGKYYQNILTLFGKIIYRIEISKREYFQMKYGL